ncbi:MAG TPA: DUF4282 domain-containing protein [Streptosporangiaceae bacterium]|nr:DUF4282 domain-containing protein [Streptosporangiaceae bacterium]
MPDRSSHQGPPEEWNRGSHAARGPFSAPAESEGYSNGTAGSHRARTSDGSGTGPTEAHGAAAADPLGTRTDSFGAGQADPFGVSQADPFGVSQADPFGVSQAGPFGARADSRGAGPTGAFGTRADSFGTSTTDGFGARVDSHHAGQTDAFGVRPAEPFGAGAADPFGDADPYGARKADPFGPAGTAAFAAVPADAGTARPDAGRPAAAIADPVPREAADTRGFLGALFDFGFTSFVTPKVIKVLYMLIVIGTVVSALVVTIIAFKASTVFGFLMLVFGDPLFILIVLAIYRIILEFFVVTFRVAEDIRALRERGDLS